MGELFKTIGFGGQRGPHLIQHILHEQILGLLHQQHLRSYFL